MIKNTFILPIIFRQTFTKKLTNKINNNKYTFTQLKNNQNYLNRKNNSQKSLSFKCNYNFSSTNPKQQFNKKFLVRINYQHSSDAYYQTYPFREQFVKQIKKLQEQNKCYLFGGDLFPMQGSLFIINCDDKQIIEQFINNNVYKKNKLIKNVEIQEVEQISNDKMKKLSYFYQYK